MTKSTKQNRFVEGRLVKVADDTYEIVFRDSHKPKKINHARDKYRKLITREHQWFLTKNDKQVVNQEGKVLTDEIRVVRVTKHNGYRQVFVRFSYDGTIWAGYTVHDGKRSLVAKATKFSTVDDGAVKGKVACRECGRPFVQEGRRTTCKSCKEEKRKASAARKKAKEILCARPGCGRVLSKQNKTGYCQKCHRTQGEFAVVRQVFNPYYGRMVDVRRKSSNDTELISNDKKISKQHQPNRQTDQTGTSV